MNLRPNTLACRILWDREELATLIRKGDGTLARTIHERSAEKSQDAPWLRQSNEFDPQRPKQVACGRVRRSSLPGHDLALLGSSFMNSPG